MHHRFPLSRLAALAVVAGALIGPSAASDARGGSTASPPVLEGLQRAEVLALLGEPDKIRRAASGEILVYKLRRVGDDHLPAPDDRLVDLPDVGRCIRRVPRPVEGETYSESLEFEPTRVTDDGRMEGGNLSRSESASVSIENGKLPKRSAPAADDQPAGSVRLFLTLGPDGQVTEWKTKGGR